MPQISSRKELEAWLNSQSREAAVTIAARAALRVLPLVRSAYKKRPGRIKNTIILPLFRAMPTAWAAGAWPARAVELRAADAADAAYAARAAYAAADAAYAAAGAAYAAAGAAADAAYAARAAADAADAAAGAAGAAGAAYDAAYDAAYAAIWNAISTDTDQILAGMDLAQLAQSSLWPGSMPDWARTNWDELKSSLLALNEDWDVWTDWYEARLRGDPPIEALEIARVLISEDLWDQGAAVVNAHIKNLIREHSPEPVHASSPGEEESANDERQPYPGAYDYRRKGDKFVAVPQRGDLPDPALAGPLLEELRRKTEELQSDLQRTNACRPRLERSLQTLMDRLASSLEDLSPVLVSSVAISIASDSSAINSDEGRAEFSLDIQTQYTDLVRSLEEFLPLFPLIQKMRAAKLTQEIIASGNLPEIRSAQIEIREIASTSEIMDESVKRALTEGDSEYESLEAAARQGDSPEALEARRRQAEIAANQAADDRNLLSRMAHVAKRFGVAAEKLASAPVRAVFRGMEKGLEKGSEKAFEKATAEALGALLKPAVEIAKNADSFQEIVGRMKDAVGADGETEEEDPTTDEEK